MSFYFAEKAQFRLHPAMVYRSSGETPVYLSITKSKAGKAIWGDTLHESRRPLDRYCQVTMTRAPPTLCRELRSVLFLPLARTTPSLPQSPALHLPPRLTLPLVFLHPSTRSGHKGGERSRIFRHEGLSEVSRWNVFPTRHKLSHSSRSARKCCCSWLPERENGTELSAALTVRKWI